MGSLNNREIASAFWLLLFLVFALGKSEIRKSLARLVRAFLRVKILVPVGLMLLHTAVVVALLGAIGLWHIGLLKDTIVWFCVTAMAMMIRFVTAQGDESIFRKIVRDTVRITIILEFLVNAYTLPLLAEVCLVPIVALIELVDVVASSDDRYAAVAKATKRVQVVVGLLILGIVVSRLIWDLQKLYSVDTARSIALAPVLSLLLSPFLYAMVLISTYELVFLRLDLGSNKAGDVKRYARRRILRHAGLRLGRVQDLLRDHAAGLMHVQTEADVDRLLKPWVDS